MTPVERALRETIKAQKEALAAKDDTIGALKGVIDLYRSGAVPGVGVVPVPAPLIEERPTVEQILQPSRLERMWMDDEEEDIAALIESGEIKGLDAEKALAALQAERPPLAVVR
jgi:hypothetical protein